MNVTGIEWRDRNPPEGRLPKGPRRHPKQPPDEEISDTAEIDDDFVAIHDESGDEIADGLDMIA